MDVEGTRGKSYLFEYTAPPATSATLRIPPFASHHARAHTDAAHTGPHASCAPQVLKVNGVAVSTRKECFGEMKKCKEAGKRYKIIFRTGPTSAFSAAATPSVATPAAVDAAAALRVAPAEDTAAGAAAEPEAAAEAPAEAELVAAAEEKAKRAAEAAAAAEEERFKSVANGDCTFIYGTLDDLISLHATARHCMPPHAAAVTAKPSTHTATSGKGHARAMW